MTDLRFYKIMRTRTGRVICRVRNGASERRVAHACLHSPTGFGTGYEGSGPADLAASILADCLGVRARAVVKEWRASLVHSTPDESALLVIRLHQNFKRDFIAPRAVEPGETVVFAAECIRRWIASETTRIAPVEQHEQSTANSPCVLMGVTGETP